MPLGGHLLDCMHRLPAGRSWGLGTVDRLRIGLSATEVPVRDFKPIAAQAPGTCTTSAIYFPDHRSITKKSARFILTHSFQRPMLGENVWTMEQLLR
jgi:hypothetical protein